MIHFAIVGCGHISKKHIEAIENVENAKLVTVCDTSVERLQETCEKYQVNGYKDLGEMLDNQPEIDVVCICVPSGLHAKLAIQAANAKKHLIVEKPIALTIQDAETIVQACKDNGVKLSVVHPNRFRPAIMALKKAMTTGQFGKISHANATLRWNRNQAYYDQAAWRGTKEMDGGVLMNQAIHNLDLLLWLMGPVEEVQGYSATRLRNIEAEDVAAATVRFQNGALGIIEAAATIFPKNFEESLSIFGESGTAVVSGTTANWIKHWEFESLPKQHAEALIQEVEHDPYGTPGQEEIIRDMVDAIRSDRDPVVSGVDGLEALKLVLAIYKSAELGKPVKLNEIVEEENRQYEYNHS
ncbi:Gfo/Idh/MocA family protein [Brevibacillus brevis]|uniref:Gfo/Idh/MocA family protein n=1 Tax=Brevibacillus brevis TaxID=1393 RepID=UPI000D0EEAAA|nr:Gfo/Idh/MocA family oxidoreductase [Brevibacillus brevis]PSJ68379.1 oxidoreductase [Brevibacillus brevis]RED34328.1 putative dehydrogenase [Brevibacillus brevis]GEC91582.1 oxidoreductase [Brevibacillus brevis]VEF92102.1 Glucose--fructose oxidoreductase precursor [Brevibacillus brevis]